MVPIRLQLPLKIVPYWKPLLGNSCSLSTALWEKIQGQAASGKTICVSGQEIRGQERGPSETEREISVSLCVKMIAYRPVKSFYNSSVGAIGWAGHWMGTGGQHHKCHMSQKPNKGSA